MYRIVLSAEAQKLYDAADAVLQGRFDQAFGRLASSPRRNAKPLHGKFKGTWCFRVGDYRIVYSINDRARTVSIVTIGHRREVYD